MIIHIFLKEMKETLRDRRTLFAMILVPLLLIPLLINLMAAFTVQREEGLRLRTLRVAVEDQGGGADLLRRLEQRKDLVLIRDIPAHRFRELVRGDSLDLALLIDRNFDAQLAGGKTGTLTILYKSSESGSLNRLREGLESYDEELLLARLEALGASRETIAPTEIVEEDVYSLREVIGQAAGGMLPYIFVLFTLIGAMYPAIDLFTGEKERGTLETILTVPVKRSHILLGKGLAVVASGTASGLISLLGLYLGLTWSPAIPAAFQSVLGQIFHPASLAWIALMLLPLTVFFAGVLIPVAIYARTFKEAQSLIQPLLIVAIVPLAVVAAVPGMELDARTALIPVVNVSLASKAIVAGNLDMGLFGLVFASLIAFAALGAWFCVRWLGKETYLFR